MEAIDRPGQLGENAFANSLASDKAEMADLHRHLSMAVLIDTADSTAGKVDARPFSHH